MTQLSLEEQIKQLQTTLQDLQKQVKEKKKEEVVKICKHCGKPFTTVKKNKKYCCEGCMNAELRIRQKTHNKLCYIRSTKPKRQELAKTKLTERTCPICNKTFMGKGNKVYCSEECKETGRKLANRKHANKPQYMAKVKAIAKLQRELLPMSLIRKLVANEVKIADLNNLWNLEEIKKYLIENSIN